MILFETYFIMSVYLSVFIFVWLCQLHITGNVSHELKEHTLVVSI